MTALHPVSTIAEATERLDRLPVGYLTLTAAGAAYPLVDREPFTPDYELARTLLVEHFRQGHTASTMLSAYRDGLIDVAVVRIDLGPTDPRQPDAPAGIVTRLVITTAPREHDPR